MQIFRSEKTEKHFKGLFSNVDIPTEISLQSRCKQKYTGKEIKFKQLYPKIKRASKIPLHSKYILSHYVCETGFIVPYREEFKKIFHIKKSIIEQSQTILIKVRIISFFSMYLSGGSLFFPIFCVQKNTQFGDFKIVLTIIMFFSSKCFFLTGFGVFKFEERRSNIS